MTRKAVWARRSAGLAVLGAAGLMAGCGGSGSGTAPGAVEIKTLSNRADLVSEGDVLVEIALPAGASSTGLQVSVDGRDVTSAFAARDSGRITGLVTGLAPGENVLTAGTANARAAQLTITNAPKGGPILSGAQVVPFVCATPVPQAVSGDTPATNASGLSTPAVDEQCNIATEYKLYYKSTAPDCSLALPDPSPGVPPTSTNPPTSAALPANPCFKPYSPGDTPPDLATTTTDSGATVPFVVRVERGTLNRGIYDIAVLFDPTKEWTATDPQLQWNGKILYPFGASTGQPRRQARPASAWTASEDALASGYMLATNSMTDSSRNSNRVMMNETVMMMKEHIADHYGPIRFTMGTGCSGGSINSNMNASIAPGTLDGITISCTYPDSETTGIEVGDCVLLVEAYQRPEWLREMMGAGYTQDQVNAKKAAINGHPDQTGCHGWYNAFGSNGKAGNYHQRLVLDNATGAISQQPTLTNNCELPASAVYDPQTNPNGARCNAWSWAESIFGKVPGTPFARDTRDNVGVQYGLGALRSGAVTPEEFVTLNEIIGGIDRDSNLIATRNTADPEALDVAYRSGIVMSGRNYAKTPVIDMRGWDDSGLVTPPGSARPSTIPIHFVWRSFSVRDRLDKEYGDHGNHVMWRFGRNGLLPPAPMSAEAFLTMDQWLTHLTSDTGNAPIEQKVRSSKPAAAFDYCLLSTDPTQSNKVTDPAACDADPFLRPSASPRQVAGGPRSEEILKCQLQPLDFAAYLPATFTAEQQARLQAVFASGVCDWSKPGIGQQPPVSPMTFASGPGGQPLGPAPVSQPK